MVSPAKLPSPDRARMFEVFSMACSFLSGIFLDPPTEAFLLALRDKNLIDEWLVRPHNPASKRGINLCRKTLNKNIGLQAKALAEDFTRLFFGPGTALAPPYESMYVGKEKILFDTSTLEVRDFYRKLGFGIKALNQMPDDHIGLELAFLSRLCGLSGTARRDDQNMAHSIACFLNDHTLRWGDRFADLVEKHALSDFYRGAAFLLKGTLEALAEFIGA